MVQTARKPGGRASVQLGLWTNQCRAVAVLTKTHRREFRPGANKNAPAAIVTGGKGKQQVLTTKASQELAPLFGLFAFLVSPLFSTNQAKHVVVCWGPNSRQETAEVKPQGFAPDQDIRTDASVASFFEVQELTKLSQHKLHVTTEGDERFGVSRFLCFWRAAVQYVWLSFVKPLCLFNRYVFIFMFIHMKSS